jgi:hypothetical protein
VYETACDIVAKAVSTNNHRGNTARITIIMLGALVTTKGITDQLMIDYTSDKTLKAIVLISYTAIGLIISIIAGLETAFRYNQKSAGLKMLPPRIKSNMRKAEDALSLYDNESEDVTGELKKINGELDKQLTEIYEQAAELDFDLASKVERALLAGRREEAD